MIRSAKTKPLTMDFASLMKSQIAAAKPAEEDGPKYLKRSEVEAQREAEYRREQEKAEQARLERLALKRKREEEEGDRTRLREEKRKKLAEQARKIQDEEAWVEENARRKRLGLAELPKRQQDEDRPNDLANEQGDLDEDELLVKLKELAEPRKLFGESHTDRLRRYRKLLAKAAEPKFTNGPIPTNLELLPEVEMKVPAKAPSDEQGRTYLFRQIASYFDMVLTEWQHALARRPQAVKESFTGKQALNNHLMAKDNLRTLFRRLETQDMPPDLLHPTLEIVHLAQLKRYVDANDAYLRLSIGKAAWPIGVTMVGIHERSAREKLHESDSRAHIMSDEATRKMLQGIKRCLSFAQTRWPPDDRGQIMG